MKKLFKIIFVYLLLVSSYSLANEKKQNLQTSVNIAFGVLIIVLFAQLMALKTEVRVIHSQHLEEEHAE